MGGRLLSRKRRFRAAFNDSSGIDTLCRGVIEAGSRSQAQVFFGRQRQIVKQAPYQDKKEHTRVWPGSGSDSRDGMSEVRSGGDTDSVLENEVAAGVSGRKHQRHNRQPKRARQPNLPNLPLPMRHFFDDPEDQGGPSRRKPPYFMVVHRFPGGRDMGRRACREESQGRRHQSQRARRAQQPEADAVSGLVFPPNGESFKEASGTQQRDGKMDGDGGK